MIPDELLATIIDPALAYMARLPGKLAVRSNDLHRVMLVAISGQEANYEARRQVGGPARGLWQFEMGGGVKGVLTHDVSEARAEHIAQDLVQSTLVSVVYSRLADNDALAACFARLLILTDPRPVPVVSDILGGWNYYLRNWRPGRPHPSKWENHWINGAVAVQRSNMARTTGVKVLAPA